MEIYLIAHFFLNRVSGISNWPILILTDEVYPYRRMYILL